MLCFVPNLIGYLRFLLILTSLLFYATHLNLLSATLWIISCILDAFDGMAARALGQTSHVGETIDIFVDNCARSLMWMMALSSASATTHVPTHNDRATVAGGGWGWGSWIKGREGEGGHGRTDVQTNSWSVLLPSFFRRHALSLLPTSLQSIFLVPSPTPTFLHLVLSNSIILFFAWAIISIEWLTFLSSHVGSLLDGRHWKEMSGGGQHSQSRSRDRESRWKRDRKERARERGGREEEDAKGPLEEDETVGNDVQKDDKDDSEDDSEDNSEDNDLVVNEVPPRLVTTIFANNFRNPLGTWTLLSIFGLPLALFLLSSGTISSPGIDDFLTILMLFLFAGRAVGMVAEIWIIRGHVRRLLILDVRPPQSSADGD